LPCSATRPAGSSPRAVPVLGTALAALALLSGLACHRGASGRARAPADVQPELTRLLPHRGYPGTEVVMEGRHLAHPLKVCFQGQTLPADRYEVLGDTRIRVRIPDDARGEAILSVTTPGGTLGRYFFVKPTVHDVLEAPFVPVHAVHNANRMLDFPGYRRTNRGARLQLPLAPVLVPRHGASAEVGQGCLLNLSLPAPFQEALPASVQALLKAQGLEPWRVELLVVSQPLAPVFHPHAWLEAGGLPAGDRPQGFKVGVALREQAAGVHFEGQEPEAFLEVAADAPFPDDLMLTGLPAQGSTAFWSVTRLGSQAAVTLHLLLDERDQQALAGLVAGTDRVSQLLKRLAGAPEFRDAATFGPFQALFRPRLAGYGRSIEGPGPGQVTHVHNGTGLAGTRAVTLEGQPVQAFQVLSDGVVQVTVPRDATGRLSVTTELGESAPVALHPATPNP